MVTNTYLKIALVLVSLVAVGLALVDLKTIARSRTSVPWSSALTISAAPKPSTTTTSNTSLRTPKRSISYPSFARLYYRRNRYTIQNDSRNLSTFSTASSPTVFSTPTAKTTSSRKFITNTSAPEIDVDVKKVALEEMQTPPFRARVDFYMVYYSPADHSELKRDLYTRELCLRFQNPRTQRTHSDQSLGAERHLLPRGRGVQVTCSFHSLPSRSRGRSPRILGPPPRATSFFSRNISSAHTPQPTRSVLLVDTPGALLEGLRCFTASRPLLAEFQGKNLSGLPLTYWGRR